MPHTKLSLGAWCPNVVPYESSDDDDQTLFQIRDLEVRLGLLGFSVGIDCAPRLCEAICSNLCLLRNQGTLGFKDTCPNHLGLSCLNLQGIEKGAVF